MNHRPWVNFKELRARLNFEAVLKHYKIEVHRKGAQHVGPCPLPSHPKEKRGSTFSANLDRGIFQCFACQAKGNALDFCGLMAGVDIGDGNELRKVAVQIQAVFRPQVAGAHKASPSKHEPRLAEKPVAVNMSLDFHLKDLDPAHQALSGLGFAVETIKHFGAGYCARGSMSGKLAIPVHSDMGELIGYAGAGLNEGLPRISFPEPRDRHGVRREFDPSLLVYNAHRIAKPCRELIVVGSILSVWRLHEHNWPNAVALYGAVPSEAQFEALAHLLGPEGRIRAIAEPSGSRSLDPADRIIGLASRHFVKAVETAVDEPLIGLGSDALDALLT